LIVLDRFHAVNKINTALELVRKAELRQARKDTNKDLIELTNCKQRFILLKKKKNLTEWQVSTLEKLCQINKSIFKMEFVKKVDTPKVLFDLSDFVQKHQVFDNQGRNAFCDNYIPSQSF